MYSPHLHVLIVDLNRRNKERFNRHEMFSNFQTNVWKASKWSHHKLCTHYSSFNNVKCQILRMLLVTQHGATVLKYFARRWSEVYSRRVLSARNYARLAVKCKPAATRSRLWQGMKGNEKCQTFPSVKPSYHWCRVYCLIFDLLLIRTAHVKCFRNRVLCLQLRI